MGITKEMAMAHPELSNTEISENADILDVEIARELVRKWTRIANNGPQYGLGAATVSRIRGECLFVNRLCDNEPQKLNRLTREMTRYVLRGCIA